MTLLKLAVIKGRYRENTIQGGLAQQFKKVIFDDHKPCPARKFFLKSYPLNASLFPFILTISNLC